MILWEGKSHIDGKPIVAIATGIESASNNVKTGAMVQIWVLRSDIEPLAAAAIGQDFSICGDCPLRRFNGGGCYVNIGQAPTAIYRAYKRGSYPQWDRKTQFNRPVRFGAYGDFAALPPHVCDFIKLMSPFGFTGYTHGWRYRAGRT